MKTTSMRAIRALIAAAGITAANAAEAAMQTSSWINYIDQHAETVDQYGRGFDDIMVFAYAFDAADNLIPSRPWVDATLNQLRANPVPGRSVYLTIVNDIETVPPVNHSGALIDRILRDPAKRAQHINQLVALSARADGIDIDYEALQGQTRGLFTQFIQELRAALPAGKKLSVVAQPKTDNMPGDRGRAIDWGGIAPFVDAVRVMVYYYSWGGSPPGPVVTLPQLRDVTRFGLSQIPASKLNVTLSLHGFDWPSGGQGQLISYQVALQRAQQFGATPFRDPGSQNLRINYTDGSGRAHQIWIDDAVSLRAKIDAIKAEGTDRVDFWSLGSGDPAFWEYVRAETNGNGPPPPPGAAAPSLSSLSPSNAASGGPGFTLRANGANFAPGTMLRWNGANRTTTFVSPTQLDAAVPASDISSPGSASITVANSTGVSNALAFTITSSTGGGSGNPVPTITTLSPSSRPPGGTAFNLTVDGSNFVSGAVVRWNGLNRPGVLQGTTRLIVYIGPNDVASPGANSVTVFNPSPGGGDSNALTFTVTGGTAPAPSNPVPSLASLSPASRTAGGGAFTLSVDGSNFVNGALVRVNGSDRATTFVSATNLTAAIPAGDTASAGSVSVTVFNPGPGGGTSNALSFTVNASTGSGPGNPVPAITTLSPSSRPPGGTAFNLTVDGSNFVSGAVVRWNGLNRPGVLQGTTRLIVYIGPNDVASPGANSVTVFNPGPGGGDSNALTFTVTGGTTTPPSNPVPGLASLNPMSRSAGSGAFTLTVNGSNFVNGALVRWNGANRMTTFISPTTLTASIPAGDVAAAGSASVTVFNPAPGGGTSNGLSFTVTGGAPPGAQTVVSLTFDDTFKDHVLAGQLLDARGMKGTFFVNSPRIGADPLYMNRADVDALKANGHEIGGHTLGHVDLTSASAAEAQRQICDDRQALAAAGYAPVSLAYPFGANNSSVHAMARDCGYSGARTVGGLRTPTCATCPNAEALPPLNAMSARTPNSIRSNMSLADIQAMVTGAEQAGGGWVPLVFHRVCDGCDISAANLGALLDWLAPRASMGTVVRTYGDAQNGAPAPPGPGLPRITALSPNTRPAGGSAFNLTVDGTGFISGSVVRWNGVNRPGVLQGTTRLIVYIPPSDTASPGTASVTVFNPGAGGGASNALPFTVTPAGGGGPAGLAFLGPAPEGIAVSAAATEFAFRQHYAFPNPSRRGQTVTIRMQTGLADSVEVRIFDISGGPVGGGAAAAARLVDDGNGGGSQHTFEYVWDVSGAGSGVYVYVVTAKKAGQKDIRKIGKIGVLK